MKNAEYSSRLRLVEPPNLAPAGETIFWKSAVGSEVVDCDGRRYIDFTSGFGVASIGFSHPRVAALMRERCGTLLSGLGDVHPSFEMLELLERLAHELGFAAKGILSSTGTEAVESSLKTAKLFTGRPDVIVFEGAYHGLGYGVLRAAGRPDFSAPFVDQAPDIFRRLPFPDAHSQGEILRAAQKLLKSGKIGAVLMEPIQGRGGIRLYPEGFISRIAELARAHGALLVLDEVMTGFGRTGSLFAFQQENVVPEVIALGKAVGGGMPISVSMATSEIMSAWPAAAPDSIHTSTFLGHPLACAVAVEVMRIIEEERLCEAAVRKGAIVVETLSDMVRARGFELRGRGLMIGIDCGDAAAAAVVVSRCMKKGLIVLNDGVRHETVELMPALNIPDELLARGLEILRDALVR